MTRIFLRKTMIILLTILKRIFLAASAVLKLVFQAAKLFLLVLAIAISGVSEMAGVTAGRR